VRTSTRVAIFAIPYATGLRQAIDALWNKLDQEMMSSRIRTCASEHFPATHARNTSGTSNCMQSSSIPHTIINMSTLPQRVNRPQGGTASSGASGVSGMQKAEDSSNTQMTQVKHRIRSIWLLHQCIHPWIIGEVCRAETISSLEGRIPSPRPCRCSGIHSSALET
jgi:hypothetical protein